MVLILTEKVLVSSLLCVLGLTNIVGNALQGAGIAWWSLHFPPLTFGFLIHVELCCMPQNSQYIIRLTFYYAITVRQFSVFLGGGLKLKRGTAH